VDAFTEFRRGDRGGKLYRTSQCRKCTRASHDPLKQRDRHLRRRYGITLEEMTALLAEQGGCATCGSTTSGGKNWHVDHDHSCCDDRTSCGKCVRGVLCHFCNLALGAIRDSPETLRNMIEYLGRADGR
jgi:hypothetical protein